MPCRVGVVSMAGDMDRAGCSVSVRPPCTPFRVRKVRTWIAGGQIKNEKTIERYERRRHAGS